VLDKACSDSMHDSNGDNVMDVSLSLRLVFTLFIVAFGITMILGSITCISTIEKKYQYKNDCKN